MSKAPKYWAIAKKTLSKRDKVMKKLIVNYKDGSLTTRNDVFFSLCKSIIGQQISVAAANSVFLKFRKACKGKITPVTVNKKRTSELKKCMNGKVLDKTHLCRKGQLYAFNFHMLNTKW